MNVLVTGGAGFIGSHLAERLLRAGDYVVILDNLNDYYDPALKQGNIKELRGGSSAGDLNVVEGDIRDRDLVNQIFKEHQPSLVYHLAAMAGVRKSISYPTYFLEVNVLGTTNVLEAATEHGKPGIVFASSSSVYGGSRRIPFRESDPVNKPVSPYAASKKACELICHTYYHLYGLSITCLRYFTVYGPRQRPEMAIHRFVRRLSEGKAIPMFGDGGSARDYTYIDDIIDGTLAAARKCKGFHIYNLGNSQMTTLRDLIAIVGEAVGVDPEIDRLPQAPGDVERTWADIRAAKKDLGYNPKTSLRDGVREFVSWYRQKFA